jgi:3-phosphoshikimate 1-carboxyvinyltransferase
MAVLELQGGQPVRGKLRVPGDKSISHRALLLAARAGGVSRITGLSTGQDVVDTRAAVVAMGAVVDGERVTGGQLHEPDGVLWVGNSGTGIRLLAGYCAAFPWLTVLAGDESIARRPMDRIAIPLRQMGAAVDGRGSGRLPPLVIRGGNLHGIRYQLPVASAQVKSAVLLAGLGAAGDTVVREPVPTRAHTEELLAICGADIAVDGLDIRVRASTLEPFELDVPGDPSQAAFWVVAAVITPGSELTVERVYVGRARSGFLDVLKRMGADIDVEMVGEHLADLHVRYSSNLHGTEVAGDEIPDVQDEVPVLAVAAAVAEGETIFRDAAELSVKETDRLATVTSELGALGGRVEPMSDGIVIHGSGGQPLPGGVAQSHGDHRIAMAAAVAGLAARGSTRIEGWEAVATSYPTFEEHLRQCVS